MSEARPSLLGAYRAFDRFFHAPCDPRICSLIRIAYALLVLLNFALVYPYVEEFWSEHGWLPLSLSRRVIDPDTWTVFMVLPQTDTVLWTCYWLAIGHAALLLVGLFSRFNAAAVFFWLMCFQHRNNLITDGEDIVFRLLCFFLLFMPLADHFSLDSRLFPRKQDAPPRSGWALRLLQIQMCVILASAGLEKLGGGHWWSGNAMYYVMKLDDFYGHYPVPSFIEESVWAARFMTWAALWTELLVPLLIWFKETRKYALIAAIGLHLGIEYMMNLFLFEWVMIVGWLSHAQWSELQWLVERLQPWRRRASVPETSAAQ